MRRLQPFANDIHVRLGRCNPLRRFLLKAMQDINRIAEFDRVDGTERSARRVFKHLENARGSEALERFRLFVFLPYLRLMQCKAEGGLHLGGHGFQILLGRCDPK